MYRRLSDEGRPGGARGTGRSSDSTWACVMAVTDGAARLDVVSDDDGRRAMHAMCRRGGFPRLGWRLGGGAR